ncbi:hypothetical protein [Microvirga calopogonii]|uniref:hypothetical protein n=1 Tax=Microvirga calopogonii TaxID=2078013 RepID=UPI000E0DA2AF|nr:hypothetical protein [Microvirga calopogonii]
MSVGDVALDEVAAATAVPDGTSIGLKLAASSGLDTHVVRATRRPTAASKPLVGGVVFTYESGGHVPGLLKDPCSYQELGPALVGRRTAARTKWALTAAELVELFDSLCSEVAGGTGEIG